MKILALILSIFTGPRYFPDFQPSHLWFYNLFRAYESLFGRRFGIRLEHASGIDKNGNEYQKSFTLENWLVVREEKVRSFFRRLTTIRVRITLLQTPSGIPVFASPYIFAIAFDAASGITNNSTPVNHTVTGSNTLMAAFLYGQTGADYTPTMSFNSVDMGAYVDHILPTADRWSFEWTLVNPASGLHSLASGSSTFNSIGALSYSGCKQSGQPDSHNSAQATEQNSTVSTTVVATNCWLVGFFTDFASFTAGSGTTLRAHFDGGGASCDSNATVGTGSQALAMNDSGTNPHGKLIMSIAPAGAGAQLYMLTGVGT